MSMKSSAALYSSQSIEKTLKKNVETISAWPSWKVASMQNSSSASFQIYIKSIKNPQVIK